MKNLTGRQISKENRMYCIKGLYLCVTFARVLPGRGINISKPA